MKGWFHLAATEDISAVRKLNQKCSVIVLRFYVVFRSTKTVKKMYFCNVIFGLGLIFNFTYAMTRNSTNDNYEITFDTKETKDNLKPLACEFVSGLIVGSRERELNCCNETVRYYHKNWAFRSLSLTTFLQTLRQWNCPQYEEQCSSRTFAFTDFSNLVYDYFCNYTLLVEKCLSQVRMLTGDGQKYHNTSVTFSFSELDASTLLFEYKNRSMDLPTLIQWKRAIFNIQPAKMTLDQLLQPCVQIAQYDQVEVFDGRYQEIVSALIPTCELSWCGFSAEAFRSHKISFWSCFSSRWVQDKRLS